jgi:hypothetical protein
MGLFDSIFGGGGAKAAKKAAKAQTEAIGKQINYQERSLNHILGLNAPAAEAGFDALGDIRTILGYDLPGYKPNFAAPIAGTVAEQRAAAAGGGGTSVPQVPLDQRRADLQSRFESSPIYQNLFKSALGEGTKSLERMAKSRGSLYSGSTLRGISDFAGQLGSQTWAKFQDTISGLAGMGERATGAAQNAVQNASNSIGQAHASIGDAQAQGYYNAAQSRQSAMGGIMGLAGTLGGAALGNPAIGAGISKTLFG